MGQALVLMDNGASTPTPNLRLAALRTAIAVATTRDSLAESPGDSRLLSALASAAEHEAALLDFADGSMRHKRTSWRLSSAVAGASCHLLARHACRARQCWLMPPPFPAVCNACTAATLAVKADTAGEDPAKVASRPGGVSALVAEKNHWHLRAAWLGQLLWRTGDVRESVRALDPIRAWARASIDVPGGQGLGVLGAALMSTGQHAESRYVVLALARSGLRADAELLLRSLFHRTGVFDSALEASMDACIVAAER